MQKTTTKSKSRRQKSLLSPSPSPLASLSTTSTPKAHYHQRNNNNNNSNNKNSSNNMSKRSDNFRNNNKNNNDDRQNKFQRNNNSRNNNNNNNNNKYNNNNNNSNNKDRHHHNNTNNEREMVSLFNRELFLLQVPYSIPTTLNTPSILPISTTTTFSTILPSFIDSQLNTTIQNYTHESPTDPILDLALSQRAAGINSSILPHTPFHGLVKHQHEDFIVQEILPDGTISSLQPITTSHRIPQQDLDFLDSSDERTKGYKMLSALTDEAKNEFKSIVKSDIVAQQFFQWYENAAKMTLQKHYSKLIIDTSRRVQWVQRKLETNNDNNNNNEDAIPAMGKSPTINYDNWTELEIPIPILPHLQQFYPHEQQPEQFTTTIPPAFIGTPHENASSFFIKKYTRDEYDKYVEQYRTEIQPFIFQFPTGEELDKAGRTAVHQYFKTYFPLYLLSDAKLSEPIPGALPDPKTKQIPTRSILRCVLYTMNNTHRTKNNNNNNDDDTNNKKDTELDYRSLKEVHWYPGPETKYLHFTLEKRDYDSIQAINQMTKSLGLPAHRSSLSFGSAGIKDRRAITTQRISLLEITAMRLLQSLYESSTVKKIIQRTRDQQNNINHNNNTTTTTTNFDTRFHDQLFDVPSKVHQYTSTNIDTDDNNNNNNKYLTVDDSMLTMENRHLQHHHSFSKTLRTLHVGQFSYETQPIQSGQLRGNQFTILVKDILPQKNYLSKQSENLKIQSDIIIGDNHPPNYTTNSTSTTSAWEMTDSEGGITFNTTNNNNNDTTTSTDTNTTTETTLSPYDSWLARLNKTINLTTPQPPLPHLYNFNTQLSTNDLQQSLHDVISTLNTIQNIGFINYFGEQRFGKYWNSYSYGWLYLTGRYSQLIKLVLSPRSGERTDLRLLKQYIVGDHVTFPYEKLSIRENSIVTQYQQGGWDLNQARRSLEHSGTSSTFVAENAIVQGLLKFDPRDHFNIVNNIPDSLLTLYTHAYQSYIWNNAVSARFNTEYMGLTTEELQKPIVGDIVMIKGVASIRSAAAAYKALSRDKDNSTTTTTTSPTTIVDNNDDENNHDESKSFGFDSEIAFVTQQDVIDNKYNIHDIVMPLPGIFTYIPQHKAGQLILEALGRDGILLNGVRKNNDGTLNNDNTQYYVAPIDANNDINNQVRAGGMSGYSLPGSYRHLIKKPLNLHYRINIHTGMNTDQYQQQQLAASTDYTQYHLRCRDSKIDNDNISSFTTSNDVITALVNNYSNYITTHPQSTSTMNLNLSFGLDPSTYATVFLREVLGQQPLTYQHQNDE